MSGGAWKGCQRRSTHLLSIADTHLLTPRTTAPVVPWEAEVGDEELCSMRPALGH